MSDNVAVRAWRGLRGQVYRQAERPQAVFIPEPGAAKLAADKSYVRLWLSEFGLATERSWTFDRKPVVKASVQVLFGKPDKQTPGAVSLDKQEFAILLRPDAGRGVLKSYPITEWLPYRGQAVELGAELFSVSGKSRLLTAIDILSEFASLVTPPISAALAIADRVAAGIERVIKANGTEPTLQLHDTFSAREPGWLVVVDAQENRLPPAELGLNGAGQLCRNGKRLTGCNYLVLRVESCREREDWLTPDLDTLITEALNARDNEGAKKKYEWLRAQALTKVYLSPDFTTSQRRKLAKVVKEELDDTSYGAVGTGRATLAAIVGRRGLPSDDEVAFLTLDELIGG